MGKIAFLYAGQGAQYPGMLADIRRESPAAARVFEAASAALGRDIAALCEAGTQEELNQTRNTQPCVLAADLAAGAALEERGVAPGCVAGFSLGEYAAVVRAGALAPEDVFPLIQLRAEAMQQAVPEGQGGMVSILTRDEAIVDAICGEVTAGFIAKANFNTPGQVVLSGQMAALDQVEALAKEKGAKAIRLAVSAPFHCAMMEPAALAIGQALDKLPVGNAALPLYMNVDARPASTAVEIREKLVLQAKSPVLWAQTLQAMAANGVDTFVELGPGKVLSGLVKRTLKDVTILRVEDMDTLRQTVEALA